MPIVLRTPEDAEGLEAAVAALREWQQEGAPMQLHPGDLGWFWRFGTPAAAAAVRTWSRDGRVLAVGLLDGPGLLRMTTAPDVLRDAELTRAVADDVSDPGRDVMAPGKAYVEAPMAALLQEELAARGWEPDEPRAALRRDLAEPVGEQSVCETGLRLVVAGPEQVAERVAVQRAAFDTSNFTAERWHAMAAAGPYADARCLLAYDEHDNAVAAVTVWSAGPGKPGLLEPMGVHRDHRGRGYGRARTEAAAAALREMGSSSAVVCTGGDNVGGVATYRAAGFVSMAEVRDMRRDG